MKKNSSFIEISKFVRGDVVVIGIILVDVIWVEVDEIVAVVVSKGKDEEGIFCDGVNEVE